MYEIELKAHVRDCAAVRERLSRFACFVGHIQKDDRYYRRPAADGTKPRSIRIRTERISTAGAEQAAVRHVLTYKRKEQRDGTEVNEELESVLEAPAALDAFLQDSGHVVFLQKHKASELFTVQGSCGEAHLELCDVPPLGYFVEIEILCAQNDAATVSRAQAELHALLAQCGVPESDIEPRYYSELLAARGG